MKAFKIVEFALEKKARNPVVLDVSQFFSLYDYFIVCSAETGRQVRAIYEEIEKKCKESNIDIHHFEDDHACRWILIDLFDILIHIFVDEARDFYNLEYLWRDAKKLQLPKKIKKSSFSIN
ncbi:MAG: ribosome silencing factor [Candidatus Omnitrophota bacterium]|nr:MAG: ribosome silencing factor [Candidatus Omnitrophota bacterium]